MKYIFNYNILFNAYQATSKYYVDKYISLGLYPYDGIGSLNIMNLKYYSSYLFNYSNASGLFIGILYFGAFIRIFQSLLVIMASEKVDFIFSLLYLFF